MPSTPLLNEDLFAQKWQVQSENDKLLAQNWKVRDGKVNAELSNSWNKSENNELLMEK